MSYLQNFVLADRQRVRHTSAVGVCFDPEATYRGVLFGTAIVTLMLTADARIHEILQISLDRFVRPVRLYIVKNPRWHVETRPDHQQDHHGCDRRAAPTAERSQA